jgi:hypothetical protein
MDTDLLKVIGRREGTSRLFVGGVHGKEGLSTFQVISHLKDLKVAEGTLVMCNFSPSPYLSTLDPLYYLSLAGGKLLDLIRTYRPEIYLELHCYHPQSHQKLTNRNRKEKYGVPALVELESGILMGSISPLIRSVFFNLHDFPFILEMPCDPSPESLKVCLEVMKIAADSQNRAQIMKKLSAVYPQPVQFLNEYFHDFSLNFWPAFQEVKKKSLKADLKNYEELNEFISATVSQKGFNLNHRQVKQLAEAMLILREHGP